MKTGLTSCILATVLLLAASPAFAAILAVGPQSCEPNYTHYATIQAAVNAAPINRATTIVVCPGIYPEQVQIIGKEITLKGVSYGGSDAAIIVPPGGGLVPNATSTFPEIVQGVPTIAYIEAMVLVQNSTATTIEDLTVDGTNNLTTCGQDPIGIFYQNASGAITRNNVLHVQVIGGFGCQGGLGIYVESGSTISNGPPNPSNEANSTVSITYNNVQDYDKNGITANGTLTGPTSNVGVTIKNNTVIGAGMVPDNAQNGIQLWGANGNISSNIIDGDWYTGNDYVATGVLILQSTAPFVETNTISNTNVGIYLVSINPDDTDNATISGNTITATHGYDGIVLCANLSTASHNIINVADESGVNATAGCGDASPSDTVTSNTINGACAGILIAPPASVPSPTGTYYNVTTPVLTTSSDTCTPPLVKKQNGSAHRRALVSPARRKLSQ